MKQYPRIKQFETLLAIAGGFTVLYLINGHEWFLYVVVGVVFLGYLFPFIGNLITLIWTKFTEVFTWVNSKIILSVIFFVFLVPFGLLYKLMTKNPLQLKKKSTSYFTERNHKYEPKDLKNVW